MHSVCRCSFPVWRRSFFKKGTPRDLFLPRPGSAPGRIWPKNNNTCKGPWVTSSLPSFIKIHQAVLEEKSKMWKVYGRTDDGQTDRQTDGRTDDGRCAMTIAHSSLRLRWAKKEKRKFRLPTLIYLNTSLETHIFMPPFEEGGILRCTCQSVCRYPLTLCNW